MASVVIIRPATEAAACRAVAGYFSRIENTHLQHVTVLTGCSVVAAVTFETGFDLVEDNRAPSSPAVSRNLPQRCGPSQR